MGIGSRLMALLDRQVGTVIVPMDPKSSADSVGLDVTTARGIEDNGDLASWPVEDGAGVSDHIFRRPRTAYVTGIVTDTPLTLLAGVHAARSILTGTSGAATAMRKLRELYDREAPVYVTCRRWTITDMMLTSIKQDEDGDTGNSFNVSLTFQQVRIVRSKLVPAEFDLDAKLAGGGGTVDLGVQSSLNPRDYTGPTAIVGG